MGRKETFLPGGAGFEKTKVAGGRKKSFVIIDGEKDWLTGKNFYLANPGLART